MAAANNIPPEPIPISQSPVPLSQIDQAPAPVPEDTTAPPIIPLAWILQAPQPVSNITTMSETSTLGPAASYAIAVYGNGVLLTTQARSFNFVGNAVVTTVDRNNVTVTINSAGTGNYGNSNVVSLLANFGSNTIGTTGTVSAGNIGITGGGLNWSNASITQTSASDLSITGDGQVTVRSLDGTYQWTFDSNGNLTAPGNIGLSGRLTVNQISSDDSSFVTIEDGLDVVGDVTADYFIGDGSQLTGISSAGNSLVNGANLFVLDANGNVVFEGANPGQGVNRGLVWDYGANANGVNSQVRQDNAGLTVRAWTEDSGNFAASVNIATNQDANTNTWIFSGDGDLLLAGNLVLPVDGSIRSLFITPTFNSNITGITTGTANVIVTIADGVFEGPFSGTVTISGVNGTTEADGVWDYQATEFDQFQLFTDATLSTPVDGTFWTSYVSGGTAVGDATYEDLTVQGGNISISSNDNTWIFDSTGNLVLPQGGIISEGLSPTGLGNTVAITPSGGSDVDQQLLVYPTTAEGNHLHLTSGNLYNTELYLGDDYLYVKLANTGNIVVNSDDGTGNTAQWIFGANGNLNLPASGNLVGSTPNNSGYMTWIGNNSGDGNGYTTLRLVPDATLTGNDQYLIVDPTAPGHIHIRAGGTQDNSSADLILGGENSFVKIAAGANNYVYVRSNSNDWTFGTDGVLTLPGEGVLQSIDDTVALQSLNTTTGNANSVYLGSGGGLGFSDQAISGNWLEIFRNGAEPEIRVPVGRGNLNIQTAEGANSYNWTFDNTGVLTTPGPVATPPVALANLTAVAGARAFVSDANLIVAGNFGNQISGGGSNTVPVWSDGTNWYIG